MPGEVVLSAVDVYTAKNGTVYKSVVAVGACVVLVDSVVWVVGCERQMLLCSNLH